MVMLGAGLGALQQDPNGVATVPGFDPALCALDLRRIAGDVADEMFQPPPVMTVSEWADENRRLPSTSAEPGRFRTDRIPYLRRIQDVLGDEAVREVTFAKSAQVAGTTAGENFIGFLIDQAPCAILEVWPSEKLLRAWSTKRLRPMLQDTPCLAAKFPQSGRRSSKDAIASKEFPGGYLQALTAKSTADLRAHSARVCVAEEVDEWEGDVGGQGDPLELLRARFRTFWNGKLFKVSTPTIEGFSRIWSELLDSSFHEYYVPCPFCKHMQTLRWRDGDGDIAESGSYRLVWDADADGEPIPGTVGYICGPPDEEDPTKGGCGAFIEERYKNQMLARGEWRARYPHRTSHIGFHINTLYSPLCSWYDIAVAFRRAVKNPGSMKGFVNLFLGLPYAERGASIDAHFLSQRAKPYTRVPNGVGLLTAGVDVQGDRIEVFVWGWGDGERSWLIAWEVLEGDPGRPEIWRKLDQLLLKAWPHESGATLRIAAAGVDAGYQTEHVHRFCEQRVARNVFALIGKEGRGRKLLTAPSAEKYKRAASQKKTKGKRPSYQVGTDAGKDLLFARLRVEDDKAPGYVHFPEHVDATFYDQLTAEVLKTKYVRGRPKRVWEPIPHRRNEALDGTVYAIAALHKLGMDTINKLGELARGLTVAGARARTVATQQRRQRGVRWSGIE